jgi:hypothetical protein
MNLPTGVLGKHANLLFQAIHLRLLTTKPNTTDFHDLALQGQGTGRTAPAF